MKNVEHLIAVVGIIAFVAGFGVDEAMHFQSNKEIIREIAEKDSAISAMEEEIKILEDGIVEREREISYMGHGYAYIDSTEIANIK